MKHAVVIGAGISGLSSAVFLADKGYQVTLLEKSSLPGGRARSFYDPKSGDTIDNGQHLMMGCYNNTLEFIKLIGAEKELKVFNKLFIPFVHRGGRISFLSSQSKIYPLNLITALLKYDAISFRERVSVVRLIAKIKLLKNRVEGSVKDFLVKNKQSEKSIKYFWEILVESMLNTGIDEAEAEIFNITIQEVFKDSSSSKFIIANNSLFELFAKKSLEFLNKHNAEICFAEPVKTVDIDNNRITKIHTNKRKIENFDIVISSIPLINLKRLNPAFDFKDFEYNSITSFYIWLNENPFQEKFYCLLNSNYHWLFNHGKYICILTSNSNKYNDKLSINDCKNELQEYFPYFVDSLITDYRMINERRATISLTQNAQQLRKSVDINLYNFYFVGDWTNTGLPGTIESAVKSSKNVISLGL